MKDEIDEDVLRLMEAMDWVVGHPIWDDENWSSPERAMESIERLFG